MSRRKLCLPSFIVESINVQLLLSLFYVPGFQNKSSPFGIFLHGIWYDNDKGDHGCSSSQKVAGVGAVTLRFLDKLLILLFKSYFCKY